MATRFGREGRPIALSAASRRQRMLVDGKRHIPRQSKPPARSPARPLWLHEAAASLARANNILPQVLGSQLAEYGRRWPPKSAQE